MNLREAFPGRSLSSAELAEPTAGLPNAFLLRLLRPALSAQGRAAAQRCQKLPGGFSSISPLTVFSRQWFTGTKTAQCISDKAQETTGQRGRGKRRRNQESENESLTSVQLTQTLSLASSVRLKQTNLRPFYKKGGCQRTSHSTFHSRPGWNAECQTSG